MSFDRGDSTAIAGKTSVLAIEAGGTNASTAAEARTNLGLGTAATTDSTDYAPAAQGVTNGDSHDHSGGDGAQIAYSSLSGTPSLGTISSQNANNVSITGGSVTGITDLAVADGGTGASTLTGYVKGNGTSAFTASSTIPNTDITGLGTMSTQAASNVSITGGSITGITDLAIADGGTGASDAGTARTNLGATTVGSNLFTLTNPSAITFPRINANNTVSTLSATDFRTAIGAGTGDGTVTSVTGTSPVASSGGTTPAISLSSGYGDTQNPYASKTANYVLAAPNGTAGVPTFRAIVAADIPTLNQNTTGTASNVTGTVAIANGGTGATDAGTARTNLGLGSIATQDASNVSITGGSITGITDLAVADGGTGASTLTGYVKGNGTSAFTASSTIPNTDITGLGTISTQAASNVSITGGSITGITDLAVADGGTGASTAQNARINLLPSYTGNASKVLAVNTGATDVEWVTAATGSGSGDVVGPASATDNAVARFDLTTGKLIQNSGVIVSDTNAVSGITQLDVDNIRVDLNTISSTDTNGNIVLAPNGTGQVVVNAGAVSTPTIAPTGDTNTGIFFPAADTIAFAEGGAEAMRINSSGNVGIGTTSPATLLHVRGSSTTAISRLENTDNGATTFDGSGAGLELLAYGMNTTNKYTPAIKFGSTDPDLTTTNPKFGASILATAAQAYTLDTTGGMNLEFWTAPANPGTGSGLVERMRIDSSGNVEIKGSSAQAGTLRLYEDTDNGTNYVSLAAPASVASNVAFTLPNADGTQGQTLLTNGSGTLSFGAVSPVGTSIVNTQTFTSAGSNTWTKPATGTFAVVRLWGAGGSGGKGATSAPAGGGGGGAFVEKWFLLSELTGTVTVTIGAGGAAQTTASTAGSAGGNSTFGAYLTAYGGGAGGFDTAGGGGGGGGGGGSAGGNASAKNAGAAGTSGRTVVTTFQLAPTVDSSGVFASQFVQTSPGDRLSSAGGLGGSNNPCSAIAGADGALLDSVRYGGGGGGAATDGTGSATTNKGGNSTWGGGGGGGAANNTTGGNGGTSTYGGNGSAGVIDANNSSAGTQPGGGSGGTEGGNSGKGGDGQCIVYVIG